MNLLLAMPGKDYPVGYIVALIFFIIALALFIVSLFMKEEEPDSEEKQEESDLYIKRGEEPSLEYSENFAEEIVKMIEEEERSQSKSSDAAGSKSDTIRIEPINSITPDAGKH